jgi:hypothetical protein
MTEPHSLAVGEEVLCDLALPDSSEQAFSPWGIGRVVRVDAEAAALELEAGLFKPNVT